MLLGYARVSDASQNHDLQMDALRTAGCERIFVETASGARADRPELARLLEQARPGDTIACWRLDRIGRSLRHLTEIAEQLERRGIALRSLTESIDTSTPSGRFLFNILGALGQMEREIIVERTKAGLRASRLRGRVGGRPRALDQTKLRVAQALVTDGNLSMAEIARQVGCAPPPPSTGPCQAVGGVRRRWWGPSQTVERRCGRRRPSRAHRHHRGGNRRPSPQCL